MADIFHDFPIRVSPDSVFRAISTPSGLDEWWTKRSAGEPRLGSEYTLWFGPEYDWRAEVTRSEPPSSFELKMIRAHEDWLGTRVSFVLSPADQADVTNVRFSHLDWPQANEHWRVSCYCWAMYLRVLRRFLEFGERVAYEKRLDV
jgi:uncharacterized protein YndB with AHSA1/START domain